MTTTPKKRIRASELSLEPLEDAASIAAAAAAAIKGPAKFTANTRGKGERRSAQERRDAIRFEEERRTTVDRRPRKTWEAGKNL